MPLGSLDRDISPPPKRNLSNTKTSISRPADTDTPGAVRPDARPTLAAVEAGQAQIRDHLDYFVRHLNEARRVDPAPLLSINDFSESYRRNQHAQGHHFVIHQHDHPISGMR